MSSPVVIAICGLKRSGKDTVADYIVENYCYKKISIAEPLKAACRVMFNLSDEQVNGNTKEEVDQRWGVSPRKIMQFVGTELMQKGIEELLPGMNRRLWINTTLSKIDEMRTPVVIPDLRFMHEYNAIKEHFGDAAYFIKVMNPMALGQYHDDMHPSETEWSMIPVDGVVINSASIAELHRNIRVCMDGLFTISNQS